MNPPPPLPRPPSFQVWSLAARPKTLAAGWVPVVVGAALAAREGALHLPSVLLALAGAAAIQVATNLHNDSADFARGTDNAERLGPPRAAQMGWLTPAQLARGAAVAAGVAVLAGLGLALRGGWPIVGIGLASLAAGWAYTGGPFPLAYLGIADFFVFLFFGVVAVAGTHYVSALQCSADALIAGAAVGLFSTAILVVNNLRDRHSDAKSNKRTLAVRFGAQFSRIQYAGCLIGGYALFAWLAVGTPGLWLTFAGLPLAVLLTQRIWSLDGADLNPWLGRTAALLALEGLLFAGGVV